MTKLDDRLSAAGTEMRKTYDTLHVAVQTADTLLQLIAAHDATCGGGKTCPGRKQLLRDWRDEVRKAAVCAHTLSVDMDAVADMMCEREGVEPHAPPLVPGG